MAIQRVCPACGAALLGDALEGLCPSCLLRLAVVSFSTAPATSTAKSIVEPVASPARYFGDYELGAEIARGGMGVVFRARQVSLDRPVAVKMILAGQLASPAQVTRFYTEAASAAKLEHPNIVPIYEVGTHEGQHFYSMKLVEGGSLAEWMATRRPPSGERLHPAAKLKEAKRFRTDRQVEFAKILVKTARAVHYAHQHGVLHRDLKPTNILLDAEIEPYVTDFGLAKVAEDQGDLTHSRAVLGTPAYMAPEQAVGSGGAWRTAGDIYSLGAILYEVLAGRPPFIGATPFEILRQVIESEPPPLSEVREELDKDLATICFKCLSKNPDARYRSSEALAEDLERWIAGEPVQARPVKWSERLWRQCKRQPILVSLWGTVVVLAIVLLVEAVAASSRIAREARRARAAETRATERLWQSLLDQARAERRSGREGQRFRSLDAVRQAAAIRLGLTGVADRAAAELELRNEAIAALALPDVRFTPAFASRGGSTVAFDSEVTVYAQTQSGGPIRIVGLRENREVALLPATGSDPARLYGFSADRRFFAVKYANGEACVWDLVGTNIILRVPRSDGCAFCGKENGFLVCNDQLNAALFFLESGRESKKWSLTHRLSPTRFNPAGDRFAGLVESRRALQVYNVETDQPPETLDNGDEIASFAWSPDGGQIAAGYDNGAIVLWNTRDGTSSKLVEAHEDRIDRVGFSRSGDLLVSCAWDRAFRLWDLSTRRQLLAADLVTPQMVFAPGDRLIAYAIRAGQVGFIELTIDREFWRLQGQPGGQRGSWSLDLSPDGRLLAASNTDGVRLWELTTGQTLRFLPIGNCRSAIFSPDGRCLITTGERGLAVWNMQITRRGNVDQLHLDLPRFIGSGQPFAYSSLCGDGRQIATALADGTTTIVYDLASGRDLFHFASPRPAIAVALSPNGRWLATGTWGAGSSVRVWDTTTQHLVHELPMPNSANVFFSPDNRHLLTASEAYRMWETGSWRELYHVVEPENHQIPGEAAFSPDSQLLAIVVHGREVRLVDADTGRRLADLAPPEHRLLSGIRFSRDGTKLAALEWDQQVQDWNLRWIRDELARLRLDWTAPAYSAATNEMADKLPLVADMSAFTPEQLLQTIPQRDPAAADELLDLTDAYNSPLDQTWCTTSLDENSLAALPKGQVILGEVRFDIRGLIQLRGRSAPALSHTYPDSASIALDAKFHRLHFLHGAQNAVRDGTEVGYYVVHFEDGAAEKLPLIYGQNTRDWWSKADEPGPLPAPAHVAWQGFNAEASRFGTTIRLFLWTWTNNRPEARATRLEFVANHALCAPFLVAVTRE
jgi:WD40 repeat protein